MQHVLRLHSTNSKLSFFGGFLEGLSATPLFTYNPLSGYVLTKMKTSCALMWVLVVFILAGITQSANPDSDPTTCCPMEAQKKCTLDKYVDLNFKRTTGAFAMVEVKSMLECFQLCKNVVPDCKAVNFVKTNNTCLFLDSLGEPGSDNIYKESNAIDSAIVNPSCDEICGTTTMIKLYHRTGSDFKNISDVQDPKECCDHCLKNEVCVAYDYNSVLKRCFMKDTIPRTHKVNNVLTGLSCPFLTKECSCN